MTASALVLALFCAAFDPPSGLASVALGETPRLALVGEYASGASEGTEIVSVQSATRRALLCNSESGTVDLLDLAQAREPKRLARHDLGLAKGETLTSVAFHPREDLFLAAIQGAGPMAPGRAELRRASDGALVASLPTGVGPDCVAFDASGRLAALACEGEPFVFDRAARRFDSAPGSVTLVELGAKPEESRSRQVLLRSATSVDGFAVAADGRFLEREVDWDGDGGIASELDFDGDGTIEDEPVPAGTWDGREVLANEKEGETFLLPLVSNDPASLEPEVVAFSPDGALLYVTLQENNGLAVIDVRQHALSAFHGLGATAHTADLAADGKVALEEKLTALREPDGIAVSRDGRFLYTADEGDTSPKASKCKEGRRAGGGRTLSVIDAASGRMLGDTGAQIDEAAAAAGVYPDERSDAKGCEPEMVVAFELDGRSWAAVSLERAGAVALVDVGDPAQPRVVSVAPCRADGTASKCNPEGLAVLRTEAGEVFLLAANEKAGTLSVFALVREADEAGAR